MLHNFRHFGDEPLDWPDLVPVFKLSPVVADAARRSSQHLSQMGVRHALVGGLALAAYGVKRVTDDVDFLVDESAFEPFDGDLLVFRHGLPYQVGEVGIDFLPVQKAPFLREAVLTPRESEGIPVVPVEALVCLKLDAWRPGDRDDLTRLVQLGIDLKRVGQYVQKNTPHLLQRWDRVVARAEE